MANRARTAPVQTQSGTTIETTDIDPMQSLQNVKNFYTSGNNNKIINGVLIALILVVGGYFGYKYLYQAPREKKAAEKLFWAQSTFAKDSTDLALKGEAGRPGFLKIIRDYSGTKSANLANYYAGICYLKGGDAKNAVKYLKEFDGEGTMAATAAHGALGNAYADMGNWKEAISHYEEAARSTDDEAQGPVYLMSLAAAYEKNNKPEDAKKVYMRIRDEFPNSYAGREIDRHLARLGVID